MPLVVGLVVVILAIAGFVLMSQIIGFRLLGSQATSNEDVPQQHFKRQQGEATSPAPDDDAANRDTNAAPPE
jgi:hypothetical protein